MNQEITGKVAAKKWSDLPYKDKMAHMTAILSFFFGWVVIFVGLLLPPIGEIDPTVISVFSIGIGYAGMMYGIVSYVKSSKSDTLQAVRDLLEEHNIKTAE